MYVWLSKILPLFVMPLGVFFLVAVISLMLLYRGHPRLSGGFMTLALVLLGAASLPIVAAGLYGRLEAAYPPVPIDQVPNGGCIVLLGGVVGAPRVPHAGVELMEAVDRVYLAAKLFRAGRAPLVIVSAGNQPWSEPGPREAELIRDVLIEWGVPQSQIITEGKSRNTRENAVYTQTIIESEGCRRPLLVTSAAHMPRAVATFRAVGLHVYPVSVDVQVAHTSKLTVMDLLPDAGALAMTSAALREWLGQVVYRLRGWA